MHRFPALVVPAHWASGESVAVLRRRAAGRFGVGEEESTQYWPLVLGLHGYVPAEDDAAGFGGGLDLRRLGLVALLVEGRDGSELDGIYGDGIGIGGAKFTSAGLGRLSGGG